jgi:hypothetical protein
MNSAPFLELIRPAVSGWSARGREIRAQKDRRSIHIESNSRKLQVHPVLQNIDYGVSGRLLTLGAGPRSPPGSMTIGSDPMSAKSRVAALAQ